MHVGSLLLTYCCQPHYDSLLVKCTVSGTTYEVARRKMLRALVEFRIRGVKVSFWQLMCCIVLNIFRQTNIPFLFRLLTHDVFIGGKTWTTVSCVSKAPS